MPRPHDPELAARCRRKCDRLLGPLRETARAFGYALALHGSVARDIDLVAVPWTTGAVEPQALIDALFKTVEAINGFALAAAPKGFEGNPAAREHGRLAWEIHLGGGPYLDISVMPTHAGLVWRLGDYERAKQAALTQDGDHSLTQAVERMRDDLRRLGEALCELPPVFHDTVIDHDDPARVEYAE